MYSYRKVVLVAIEKCNPVYLILFLKGHSTFCPHIIIKIFHLGVGQQFIRPGLCLCRHVPALRKKPAILSGTVASGKVNPTDGVKYIFIFCKFASL